MKVKILETIDYTLKRKGDRFYTIIDGNGRIVDGAGLWKTKAACRRRLEELRLEYTGTVTEHQNYKHWADFQPVKEGKMLDENC